MGLPPSLFFDQNQNQGQSLEDLLFNGSPSPAPAPAPAPPAPQQAPSVPDTPDSMASLNSPTQQSPPQNNSQNAGPVKAGLRAVLGRMLSKFSYGAGQSMIAASGGETDAQRATRLAQTAHLNAQTKLIQQQSEMTPVQPYGPNGPTVYLPSAAAASLMKQQLANQGKVDVANVNKRFVTTGQGLYDTQNKDANGFPSLIPNSGAGITITPEMTSQYPIPKEFVGKQIKLTDLAALERGQAFQNAMVQTAAGPVIVPKAGPNMGQATPVTINGQKIPSNQEAGAYWQAKYGVVQTVDNDGNPQYVSRLSAPGAAPATGALQIMKGKAGLENYKDALNRVSSNLDVLDDPSQRALIAQTMRNIGTIHDPGIISSTIGNAVSNGLNPRAADLTAAMLQAREFIGANRQFAGNFNGSEALYNRMVANAPGVANSKELNQALIAQDLANTSRIEQNLKKFQGGKSAAAPSAPATKFNWDNAPVVK